MDGYKSIIYKENGTVGEIVDRKGINVGEYVNYIPDVNSETYVVTSEMSG